MYKFALFLALIGTFFLYGEGCPFCDPEVIDYQRILENERAILLYSHKPILEGHSLIIPKRHVSRFEDLMVEEMVDMMSLIKQVNKAAENFLHTTSYFLLQKNGAEAGQSVAHLHFHYVPTKQGEFLGPIFLFKFYTRALFPPIEKKEMAAMISGLRSACA